MDPLKTYRKERELRQLSQQPHVEDQSDWALFPEKNISIFVPYQDLYFHIDPRLSIAQIELLRQGYCKIYGFSTFFCPILKFTWKYFTRIFSLFRSPSNSRSGSFLFNMITLGMGERRSRYCWPDRSNRPHSWHPPWPDDRSHRGSWWCLHSWRCHRRRQTAFGCLPKSMICNGHK